MVIGETITNTRLPSASDTSQTLELESADESVRDFLPALLETDEDEDDDDDDDRDKAGDANEPAIPLASQLSRRPLLPELLPRLLSVLLPRPPAPRPLPLPDKEAWRDECTFFHAAMSFLELSTFLLDAFRMARRGSMPSTGSRDDIYHHDRLID